jgi:hypothetical protein
MTDVLASASPAWQKWFYFERPAMNNFASYGDQALTVLLFITAIIIVLIALQPNRPILKAIVFGWIISDVPAL